jgi:solute carrier family 45, member 1/2/4
LIIGWFPFLFYSTTWVGETYFRYDASASQLAQKSDDALGEIGRVGSSALVAFSIVSLIGSVVLPLLVKSAEDDRPQFTPRPPAGIAPLVSKFVDYKPDLVTAWMLSHLIFAGSMALAPFTTSFRFATVLVSLCGM